jgi:hypothetical protein
MSNQMNPYILWAANSVQKAAQEGMIFKLGKNAPAEFLEALKAKNDLLADYIQLRGVLELEELNEEVGAYILYLNSPEGEKRKEHFLNFLKEGKELTPLSSIGSLILSYNSQDEKDPKRPTAMERILALDMLNASAWGEFKTAST